MNTPAWAERPIVWKQYTRTHNDFGQPLKEPEVWCEGWGVDAPGFGIASDYAGAIALNSDCWEEFCAHHREAQ